MILAVLWLKAVNESNYTPTYIAYQVLFNLGAIIVIPLFVRNISLLLWELFLFWQMIPLL